MGQLDHFVLSNGKQVELAQAQSSLAAIWRNKLWAPFIPEGFPHSVTQDYTAFQVFDSLQAVSSYVRGIICAQAFLKGIVGKEAATPLAAVMQWFIKDFSGHVAGVLFAGYQGSNLDVYAKQWRLFADCLNNVGMCLELIAPNFPSFFLVMACLGSVARAITGAAAGAVRAALTQHFAIQQNAADVSAKEGCQETATTLLGMLLGMALTYSTADSPTLVWAAFLSLTYAHVYCNIRAVRALVLNTMNPARMAIFLQQARTSTPERMAQLEPLFPPTLTDILWQPDKLRVQWVACTKEDLDLLGMAPEQPFVVAQRPGHCLVAFAENATALDKLAALAGGCLLQRYHAQTAKSGKHVSAEEVGSKLMPVAEAVYTPLMLLLCAAPPVHKMQSPSSEGTAGGQWLVHHKSFCTKLDWPETSACESSHALRS